MDDGLNYSEVALMNRVLFFSQNSDIVVFVEDVGKEYLYEVILERMLVGKTIRAKTLAVGGKSAVISAFDEYGDVFLGKPMTYIVDGDFDLMLEKDMINDSHFIYLKKYNIEDYLVDENAVIDFMIGKLKRTRNEVKNLVKFHDWEKGVIDEMHRLFVNFVIAQACFVGAENVGNSPYKFFDNEGYPNTSNIEAYIQGLKNQISDYDIKYSIYEYRFQTILKGDVFRLVCGKYLIASLTKYLKFHHDVRFALDDFTYSLTKEFDIHSLDYVKDIITSLAERHESK